MNSEILIKTIDDMKQEASSGNRNLLLETPQEGHITQIKTDALDYESGERDKEKWKAHLQSIENDLDLTGKQFAKLEQKVIEIFEDIVGLKSPCAEIQAYFNDGKYNVNHMFSKMQSLETKVEEIIAKIIECGNLFPSIYEDKSSSTTCVLFHLAIIEVQLQTYIQNLPKDVDQLDKNIVLYQSIFDFINNYTLANAEKNKDGQLELLFASKDHTETHFETLKSIISPVVLQ